MFGVEIPHVNQKKGKGEHGAHRLQLQQRQVLLFNLKDDVYSFNGPKKTERLKRVRFASSSSAARRSCLGTCYYGPTAWRHNECIQRTEDAQLVRHNLYVSMEVSILRPAALHCVHKVSHCSLEEDAPGWPCARGGPSRSCGWRPAPPASSRA